MILPFISHSMSPSEFGAASMLTASALLVTAIVAQPLVQLIIRAAARGEDDGPALLRVMGLYCYVVLPVAVGLVAAGLALFVPQFLGVTGHIWTIELLAIGFQPAASVFGLWVAQAREDLRRFVWLSSTSVLVTAISKLVMVVGLNMGIAGWVLSDLISAIISALLAFSLIRIPRAQVRSEHIRYTLRFSLPLVPHSASLWALASLSRPAMAAVSSLEQVGLLSFGLQLAQIAGLILTETNRAVLPGYSRETFPAPTARTLGPVRWQLLAALSVPAFVGCGVAMAGQWIFAETYWSSFFLTGILLVGQAAFGLYLIPMNYLTQTAGLPKYSSLASGAGATLILLAILVLGRTYGAVGVAYATSAGYFAMAAVAMLLTWTHGLEVNWRSWLFGWRELLIASVALACAIAGLVAPVGSTTSWSMSGVSLTLLMGAALLARRTHR